MISIREESSGRYTQEEFSAMMEETRSVLNDIRNSADFRDSLGWMNPRKWASEEAIERLLHLSDGITEEDAVLVLIGVGGSNNGARSAIKALKGDREVFYAGNNLSADYLLDLLQSLSHRPVYINIIAKNFETLEPGLSFRIFRQYLEERYGADYSSRVFVTGTAGSQLHELCKIHGYTFLFFPDDIGGRFSVLSDVGLFPMAFAGIDIRSMVNGAQDMSKEIDTVENHGTLVYSASRNLLHRKGYCLEMLISFEPRLDYLGKWWIQLFAESEGKDGKGIFPVTSSYSEDLHSVGQYIQDGRKMIIETFLQVEDPGRDLNHLSLGVRDGFDYLDGKSLQEINKAAFDATVAAHHEEGIPEIFITLPRIDAYHLGQLFYFFMMSVYISGRLLGINPFDQPGVESYKRHMFRNLGKVPR